ncbi:hypothetical protein V6N11_076500 [Hibiscus sabdariffa]|uniref:Uncharacterized protein n=2 Tax=Hibiscus sabdariffa TaxID=183260 RepID=A0ABR1ZT15_9ROSI
MVPHKQISLSRSLQVIDAGESTKRGQPPMLRNADTQVENTVCAPSCSPGRAESDAGYAPAEEPEESYQQQMVVHGSPAASCGNGSSFYNNENSNDANDFNRVNVVDTIVDSVIQGGHEQGMDTLANQEQEEQEVLEPIIQIDAGQRDVLDTVTNVTSSKR